VVIDAELGRKDHSLIFTIAIGKELNHLIPELTPEPNSTGGEKKILLSMTRIALCHVWCLIIYFLFIFVCV
jgi:hypothetical protein